MYKIRGLRQKRDGVSWGDFQKYWNVIVEQSYDLDPLQKEISAEGHSEEQPARAPDEQSVWNYFIISRHNKIYLVWQTIDILCCLSSSYLCAYMAAFENPQFGSRLFTVLYV